MSEIAELRRQVEDLSQRVVTLELALSGEIDPYMKLGLSPSEAKVLALLMKRVIVGREAFQILLYGIDAEPHYKSPDVHISRIRTKLQIPIEVQYRNGWWLTAQAKFRVNQLVEASR